MEISSLPLTPVQAVATRAIESVLPVQGMAASSQADPAQAANPVSFQQFLGQAIGQTNQALLQADDMSKKLATGEAQDLHQVMISLEKADLSLQFVMQTRSKVLDAYQSIMAMQV
jgi:flagellar hook-basal body complex protein FliE